MTDLEKVIRGLECCSKSGPNHCDDCPYQEPMSCQQCYQMRRDALELLKNRIWISVKDGLPDIGEKCLVYANGKMTVAKHINNNDWITGVFFPIPTHWMPLPEPPKEETHG